MSLTYIYGESSVCEMFIPISWNRINKSRSGVSVDSWGLSHVPESDRGWQQSTPACGHEPPLWAGAKTWRIWCESRRNVSVASGAAQAQLFSTIRLSCYLRNEVGKGPPKLASCPGRINKVFKKNLQDPDLSWKGSVVCPFLGSVHL